MCAGGGCAHMHPMMKMRAKAFIMGGTWGWGGQGWGRGSAGKKRDIEKAEGRGEVLGAAREGIS